MFSCRILAVLPLLLWTALAVDGLQAEGSDAKIVSPWSSNSQSSASAVISSFLASLSSDAAFQTTSTTATSSTTATASTTSTSLTASVLSSRSSSVPTQFSSTTTSSSGSTSYAIPTSSIEASTSSAIPTNPIETSTSPATPLSSTTAIPVSTSSSSTTNNRKQTIILAICFTFLGLIILTVSIILFRRYRRRQSPFSPFSRRGASPIDDDEIATWRGNTQPMAKNPVSHVRSASSIVFQPYPGWSWNFASSTDSTSPGASPPGSGEALPYPPPPPVAYAPNSRTGLTDGAIPGAAPFVALTGRQSRRLSKAPSTGHMRSKSRRSSVSLSSIHEPRTSISNSQWVEPKDWEVQRKLSNSGPRTPPKTAIGRTSMGDDVRPGGLSPRPVTNTNEVRPQNLASQQ